MRALYAIAGNPVDHSLSPQLHTALYRQFGFEADYQRFEVTSLAEWLKNAPRSLKGLSITTPLKDEAAEIATNLDAISTLSRSVNTMQRSDGLWLGFNTDGPALIDLLRHHQLLGSSRRILILGAGGTARAMAVAARQQGIETIIATRSPGKTAEFAQNAECLLQSLPVEGNFDALINATSVWSAPASSPLAVTCNNVSAPVRISVHYQKKDSVLFCHTGGGSLNITGIDLFIFQALRQIELWHGVKPTYQQACKALPS